MFVFIKKNNTLKISHIQRIAELFAREVCKFLKKQAKF